MVTPTTGIQNGLAMNIAKCALARQMSKGELNRPIQNGLAANIAKCALAKQMPKGELHRPMGVFRETQRSKDPHTSEWMANAYKFEFKSARNSYTYQK